jgi:hypothetical protein
MPENRVIASEKDWEGLFSPEDFARRNHLLLIAIDEYAGSIPALSNAVRDAEAFAKVLLERYRFEETAITRLHNARATRAEILKTLRHYVDTLTADDCLLIYYSGHGTYDAKFDEGYWVPADATAADDAQFIASGDLVVRLRACAAHHIVLISDSCFSGSLFVENKDVTAFANRVDGLPSRWGIASGRHETVSDGVRGKNSPFADQLLYFLEKNQQPHLPIASLAQHVEIAVAQNAKQTPIARPLQNVGDRGGQFIFRLRDVKSPEQLAWEEAQRLHSISGYDNFIDKYPQSQYAQEAHTLLHSLEEERDWAMAKSRAPLVPTATLSANTPKDNTAPKPFPAGRH